MNPARTLYVQLPYLENVASIHPMDMHMWRSVGGHSMRSSQPCVTLVQSSTPNAPARLIRCPHEGMLVGTGPALTLFANVH